MDAKIWTDGIGISNASNKSFQEWVMCFQELEQQNVVLECTHFVLGQTSSPKLELPSFSSPIPPSLTLSPSSPLPPKICVSECMHMASQLLLLLLLLLIVLYYWNKWMCELSPKYMVQRLVINLKTKYVSPLGIAKLGISHFDNIPHP